MSRRLFAMMVVLLCALGALLLLSALVDAPQAETVTPAQMPVSHTMTAFVSMPPVPVSASALPLIAWLRIAALFMVIATLLPRLHCTCDANGRVLHNGRYVRSFYPVFRQDLACG